MCFDNNLPSQREIYEVVIREYEENKMYNNDDEDDEGEGEDQVMIETGVFGR